MTIYRIVEPDGDPDKRRIEWCRGEDGRPAGEWKNTGDNVAACYEILFLRAHAEAMAEHYRTLEVHAFTAWEYGIKVAERAGIRQELWAWLVGDIDPKDAGLVNGRRIVDEINRICPEEG